MGPGVCEESQVLHGFGRNGLGALATQEPQTARRWGWDHVLEEERESWTALGVRNQVESHPERVGRRTLDNLGKSCLGKKGEGTLIRLCPWLGPKSHLGRVGGSGGFGLFWEGRYEGLRKVEIDWHREACF